MLVSGAGREHVGDCLSLAFAREPLVAVFLTRLRAGLGSRVGLHVRDVVERILLVTHFQLLSIVD